MGESVAPATAAVAFSLSRTAFAVACCSLSESDLSRAASGVDTGFTLVSGLSEREHPAVKMPAARSKSKNLFMNWNERRNRGECNSASVRVEDVRISVADYRGA